MRGFGSHWSASLLIRSHPVRSFWLRRVSMRIQSTVMWYRNAAGRFVNLNNHSEKSGRH